MNGDSKMAVDPVCGMTVDEKTVKYKAEYNDKIYYFCCEMCYKAFLKDPSKYVK